MGCLTGDQIGAHLEIFTHAHLAEQMAALRHLDQTALHKPGGRQAGDVAAGKFDAAALQRGETRNRAHQCGLAGAIGAEQPDDLPLPDHKIDVADNGDAAIAGAEMNEAQRHAASPR